MSVSHVSFSIQFRSVSKQGGSHQIVEVAEASERMGVGLEGGGGEGATAFLRPRAMLATATTSTVRSFSMRRYAVAPQAEDAPGSLLTIQIAEQMRGRAGSRSRRRGSLP